MEDVKEIRPQPKQLEALKSAADILFFGGAAGGGKSWTLLMEAMRHVKNAEYQGVIFRRTHPMISAEGGLWEKSNEIYPLAGARPYRNDTWIFPSGATIRFAHMQHEKNKYDWHGAQIPFIAFDEVVEFSETMFWYMLTRNRSTCGIRPLIRAACNPDSESWVARFIEWWIDQDTGYAIPERSGKLRWIARINENIEWADSWLELHKRFPNYLLPPTCKSDAKGVRPKSVTFIPSMLSDNVILETKDPAYRSNLNLMQQVERERLLGGNWKIRPAAGLKFPRTAWRMYQELPPGITRFVRFWDKAYTQGGSGAMTAGVLVGELIDYKSRGLPRFWILDCVSGRWGDAEREAQMLSTCQLDRGLYGHVMTGIEDEGGAGKQATNVSINNLAGFSVYREHPTKKKSLRWGPLASQQQIGNVGLYQGDWDWVGFVRELDLLAGDEVLDKGKLKDKADAASGAFKGLTIGMFDQHQELISSGDLEPDEKQKFSKAEVEELPEFLKELVQTYQDLGVELDTRDEE